jgi:hypothetical protein
MQELFSTFPQGSYLYYYIKVDNLLSVVTPENEFKIFAYFCVSNAYREGVMKNKLKRISEGREYVVGWVARSRMDEDLHKALIALAEPEFLIECNDEWFKPDGTIWTPQGRDAFVSYLEEVYKGYFSIDINKDDFFNKVALPKPIIPCKPI